MIEMDKNAIIEKLARDFGFMQQIRKRVSDHNMAEDVLQKTLIKAYENWDKLRDKNRFYPWIFQIMKNEALKSVIENKRWNYCELPLHVAQQNSNSNLELRFLLQKTLEIANFYTRVEQKVAQVLVDQTIAGIPCEAIMKNIAIQFSFKMNYVTSILYRVRYKINKYLQQHGYADSLPRRKAQNASIERCAAKNRA